MKRMKFAALLAALCIFSTGNIFAQSKGANTNTNNDSYTTSDGRAVVLLLPTIGGNDDENATLNTLIMSLRDIHDAVDIIDESNNTAILPAGFKGTNTADTDLLFNLANQHKANYIVFANIERFGQRNLAVINRFNTRNKQTDISTYLEYSDPIEAWVKLPMTMSSLLGFPFVMRYGEALQIKHGNGVDKAWTEKLVALLISDYLFAAYEKSESGKEFWDNSIPDYISGPRFQDTITPIVDRTYEIEEVLASGGQIKDTEFVEVQYIVETSRRGNKTRMHILSLVNNGWQALYNANWKPDYRNQYDLEYTDTRDFIRQMRGISLTLLDPSWKRHTGYDLGIDPGIKYNYWQYSGEGASMTMIEAPRRSSGTWSFSDMSIDRRLPRSLEIVADRENDYHFYIAEEDDFSKAVRATVTNRGTNTFERVRHVIQNLKPNTVYYVWTTITEGNLLFLQSPPSKSTMVRTRAE